MAIYKNKRRSGFRDFLDGFTGTYNAMNDVFQDFETTDIMNEKPQEISSDQLTDEQYAEQQLATQGPVAPKQTRYDGKTYSGTLDDRKLTGLRMGRLADVAAKYGDAKGAMGLRKQVADMEYEDRTRARTELGWQREDDDYRRRQQARGVMAEIDPTNPESYVVASGKLTALGDAQGAADVMRQGGQQKEWMKARENEGVDRVDQLIRSNASPDEIQAAFNATGAMRLDGPPTISRTKDKTGREVVSISGSMDGKPFNISDWDEWLTGRMSVDKRQAAAAQRRDEVRNVEKIAEDTRRWNENYKLEDRRTRAAEESARAARESTRLAREQQAADRTAQAALREEGARAAAAKDIQEYAASNQFLYDNVDGKPVLNPQRQAAYREFLNAHQNGIEVDDGKGGKRMVKIDLGALNRRDPQAARQMVDRLTDQFLLHQAAEEATGKKLPYYSKISYGDQNAGDYTKRQGLGLGSALKNALLFTDGRVIRYGDDVSLDYSTLVDSPHGERIKRALDGREDVFRASESLPPPPTARPQGLRQVVNDPRARSLLAANEALGVAIREAAAKNDVETVQRLTDQVRANAEELRKAGVR